MAQKSYNENILADIKGSSVAIVQAKWHSEHTDNIVLKCSELLKKAGAVTEHHIVPGNYELPLSAKLLAKKSKFDAIVVVGAIIKGDTDHYEVILETCIEQLGRVMYDYEVPIIMELLPVRKLQDLIDRCEGEHNKGIEAAHAAIDIIRWKKSL